MKTNNFGFIKIASAIPNVKIADCQWNTSHIEALMQEADANGATIVVFPELSITAYTCGDLFRSHLLQEQALESLNDILCLSRQLRITAIVGLPIAADNQLFNCAAVIHRGRILAIVPKTHLPNYNEFYEQRWFSPASSTTRTSISILSQTDIPFGQNVIIHAESFTFGIELCEDLWTPCPPSSTLALGGAQIIFNLSASNEIVGKHQYLKSLIQQQSARCMAAYIYSSAGFGESSTDLVFGGNAIIAECGTVLSENQRFSPKEQIIYADIDIERIIGDRQNNSTFRAGQTQQNIPNFIHVGSDIKIIPTELTRRFPQNPFVPSNDDAYQEILDIQVAGLCTRLHHTNMRHMVVGVSGGLDSTLALLVCAKTCDRLDISRSNIIGVTMPGFGTTNRTYTNATQLISRLGATLIEIPIKEACLRHFHDIGHNPDVHDITYENSQARERTQILMDISNKYSGLVIGTGDLSELALGWATYNGDHMSMYAVNASVPKTLIRHLIQYICNNHIELATRENLIDVINTPVSPELLPAAEDGTIAQITEDLVGPYQLHDFFLYHTLRHGFSPEKIEYLANITFKEAYSAETIKHWLSTFFRRFFSQQFKRSCLPDGPKIGSVCLSPRGDWRMPSDASSRIWLENIQ